MPQYNPKDLQERYQKLPPPLKDAFFNPDVSEKVFQTGRKFGLNIEKIGLLAEEVAYIVLGLSRPELFIKELGSKLEVDLDRAREIAKEINHQIFFPLRQALKETHQIEFGEEAFKEAGVMPPAPKIPEGPGLINLGLNQSAEAKPETKPKETATSTYAPEKEKPSPKPPETAKTQEFIIKTPEKIKKVFEKQMTKPVQPTPPPKPAPSPIETKQETPSWVSSKPRPTQSATIDLGGQQKPLTQQPITQRIPPIDLRNAPKPAPAEEPQIQYTKPVLDKKIPYGGIDPYREQPR